MNCNAVLNACNIILERLKRSALEETGYEEISKIELKDGYVFYNSNKTGLSWHELKDLSF